MFVSGERVTVVYGGRLMCGYANSPMPTIGDRAVWIAISSIRAPSTMLCELRDYEEGLTWIRGHDPNSPQACALRVAAALS